MNNNNLEKLVDSLYAYLHRGTADEPIQAPQGLCPNCWGEQEYDGRVRELFRDHQIAVNNHEANYAFIQQFVITHLDGIRLRKGSSGMKCPTCRVQFREEKQP